MRYLLNFLLLLLSLQTSAQSWHIGISGGMANYNGDMLDKLYVMKQTNGYIGADVHYEISARIQLRAGFNFARVNGNDRYGSKDYLQKRNLNFESAISEFSLGAEFFLFDLSEEKMSPYLFASLAYFHFNPYTYDSSGKKTFLSRLSTEGQGLYPDRKKYSLSQIAIPVGGGLRVSITDNIRIGFELGFRKLFTDYLDDVSTTYADYNDLLSAKGPVAVGLAYREDELPGGNPLYPDKGTQRGNYKQKDTYYFTGLTISYRLGYGGGSMFNSPGKKGKYGCPTVPL
jgi:hypothetical protein